MNQIIAFFFFFFFLADPPYRHIWQFQMRENFKCFLQIFYLYLLLPALLDYELVPRLPFWMNSVSKTPAPAQKRNNCILSYLVHIYQMSFHSLFSFASVASFWDCSRCFSSHLMLLMMVSYTIPLVHLKKEMSINTSSGSALIKYLYQKSTCYQM